MAFLDKVLRWNKKPFNTNDAEKTAVAPVKVAKKEAEKNKGEEEAMGSGLFAHILLRPHISEKTAYLQESNQYVFEVDKRATKGDVAQAIKGLYGKEPIAVNIINMRGKNLRFGKTEGKTKNWKKAIITLAQGVTIDPYK